MGFQQFQSVRVSPSSKYVVFTVHILISHHFILFILDSTVNVSNCLGYFIRSQKSYELKKKICEVLILFTAVRRYTRNLSNFYLSNTLQLNRSHPYAAVVRKPAFPAWFATLLCFFSGVYDKSEKCL